MQVVFEARLRGVCRIWLSLDDSFSATVTHAAEQVPDP